MAACLAATSALADTATPSHKLVTLTRVAEFELQHTRYLLDLGAQDDRPQGFAACVAGEAAPRYAAFFANLFETELTAGEREEATAFFSTPEAQQALALRMDHEHRKQQAMVRNQAGPEGRARYPAPLRALLDGFAAHRISSMVFSEQDALNNSSHRLALSDLRVASHRVCWRALQPG